MSEKYLLKGSHSLTIFTRLRTNRIKREIVSDPDISAVFIVRTPSPFPDWITGTDVLNEDLTPEDIEGVTTTCANGMIGIYNPVTVQRPGEIAELLYWYRNYLRTLLRI